MQLHDSLQIAQVWVFRQLVRVQLAHHPSETSAALISELLAVATTASAELYLRFSAAAFAAACRIAHVAAVSYLWLLFFDAN